MKKSERAVELFEQGYNCAQAVFGAFAEDVGISEEQALRLSAPFGGGVGRLREICGACSGMLMTAGMLCGYTDPKDAEAKKEHYAFTRELCDAFKAQNGSIICREILSAPEVGGDPAERTEQFYKERPCVRCVRTAAEIAERLLEENK